MDFGTSRSVDVYITADDNPSSGLCIESDETAIEDGGSSPRVFITQLPKGLIPSAQEFRIQIPSKEMGVNSETLLSQLESDGDGNSIVTIHVPIEDLMQEESEEDVHTIDIEISEDCEQDNRELIKNVTMLKDGDIIMSSGNKYVVKAAPTPHSKRVPIWKRHIPKPPGSVSNYLYPHYLRNARNRVIFDCPTNIPVPEFKSQLSDTSDIVTTLEVAPSTKRRIKELTTNSVARLFAHPGRPFPNKKLYALYHRHLTSHPQTHEQPSDLELMPLGYCPTIDYSQVKRISRKRKQNEPEIVSDSVITTAKSDDDNTIVKSMVPISDQMVRVLIKPGVMGDEEQEIIVLTDGAEKTEDSSLALQHSIEVLLAAAESGAISKEASQVKQIFISDEDEKVEKYQEVYVCDDGTIIKSEATDEFMTEQIIILRNEDLEET